MIPRVRTCILAAAAAAAALAALAVLGSSAIGAEPPAPDRPLTVMTYNIRTGIGEDNRTAYWCPSCQT